MHTMEHFTAGFSRSKTKARRLLGGSGALFLVYTLCNVQRKCVFRG